MSAGTAIKTLDAALDEAYPTPDSPHTSVMMQSAADRVAFMRGWQGRDAEIAELRAALEAAEQKLAHYALAEKAVESSLLNAGLSNDEWADKFFAAPQPDSGRDAALLNLTADETAAILAWLEIHRNAHQVVARPLPGDDL